MSDTAILEIVELANGEVVLRPAEATGEPLVSIRFSEEAVELLRRSRFGLVAVRAQTLAAGPAAVDALVQLVPWYRFRDFHPSTTPSPIRAHRAKTPAHR